MQVRKKIQLKPKQSQRLPGAPSNKLPKKKATKNIRSVVIVNRKKIELSNTDRILFPKAKITKGDLIAYYAFAAPMMLALVKNHLLTLQRYPSGIQSEGFYQKDAGTYFPSWIKQISVAKHEGGTTHYVVATSQATFVYLANQATIAFHSWLSRADKLDYPDRMIFDLDPSAKDFSAVRHAALELKTLLDAFGLVSFPLITGSRGIHVVIPLKRSYTYDQVAACADYFAQRMIKNFPEKYTQEIRKVHRGTKIFIDTLRNRKQATAIVPYSVRVKDGASIALPISWKQVENSKLRPDGVTIKDRAAINASKKSWAKFGATANSLATVLKVLR